MSSNSERIHHRYSAEISVTVRWRKESQTFRACDVSLGGLFILTDTPPALRELLRLEFSLPPHDTKLTVHAMTVNVSHRNDPEGRLPGAGLQLYAMDREAQKVWSSYIDHVRKTMGTTSVKAARPPLVPAAPIAPHPAPPAALSPPVPPPLPPAHTTPAAPPSATRPLPPTVLTVPQAASPLIRPAPVQSVLAPPPVPSVVAPPMAPSMLAPPPAPSMLAPPMAPSVRSPGPPVIPGPPKVPAPPFTPSLGPKAPPPHASHVPARVTTTTPSGAPKVPFKPALHRAQGGFKPRAAGQTTASLTPNSLHTSKSTVVKVESEPRSTENVFPVEDDGFVILR